MTGPVPNRGWTPADDTAALKLAVKVIDAQEKIIAGLRAGAARPNGPAIETVRNCLPRLRRYTNPTEEP